jgi:hypothetical protein
MFRSYSNQPTKVRTMEPFKIQDDEDWEDDDFEDEDWEEEEEEEES